MWLQRFLFNFQTRLLGREDQAGTPVTTEIEEQAGGMDERVELFKNRLIELDRRFVELD